ncbi:MAG TPA: hypothetical protein VJU84_04080 [Pyrinomonadaceae bacterium]|nr:hypothetical protein [Pyrinomonadaceae bacterium]
MLPTIRKRDLRIGRGAGKPDRKPFKTPRCIARLIVEDVQQVGDAFVITLSNSGNLASHHVRINVYEMPVGGEPEDVPFVVATRSTTLGILERKQVSVIKESGGISRTTPYYAVAFDPINDPFPVGRVRELYLQERNLLASTLWYSLPGWKQYSFNDNSFSFGEAEEDDLRTWELNDVAELTSDNLPPNPRITEVLYPHETPTDYSEFRYQVDINNPFFLSEIAKGNVTVHSSCMLYTYKQTPRDRGGFWLRQQDNSESPLVLGEQPLASPQTWIDYPQVNQTEQIDADPRLTTIIVRLIAERRERKNNSSYFGNPFCAIKHRQVKKARHA